LKTLDFVLGGSEEAASVSCNSDGDNTMPDELPPQTDDGESVEADSDDNAEMGYRSSEDEYAWCSDTMGDFDEQPTTDWRIPYEDKNWSFPPSLFPP
jgi:hypothetical protein